MENSEMPKDTSIPDLIKAYNRLLSIKNSQRKYASKPEAMAKARQLQKERYAKNKEKILEQKREYYSQNSDKVSEQKKERYRKKKAEAEEIKKLLTAIEEIPDTTTASCPL